MGWRTKAALIVVSAAVLVAPGSALATASIDAATNQYRASQGLPPLTTWSALQTVANRRVIEIQSSFAHPTNWQYLFDMLPSCTTGIGENIAFYTTGAEPAGWPVSAWIASDSHRTNMLRAWTWQASAMVAGPNNRTYAVQLFAKGCTSTPAPAPQPPAPQPPSGGGGAPIAPDLPDTSMAP